MTGADAMVKCLEAQGIDVVFGYPGVAIAPFYNSLYDSKIQSILVRQEQNGGHAASGSSSLKLIVSSSSYTASASAESSVHTSSLC